MKTDNTTKCDVCGGPASATLDGARPISTCATCAVDKLPRLAADALPDVNERFVTVARERIACAFLHAVSLRSMRQRPDLFPDVREGGRR